MKTKARSDDLTVKFQQAIDAIVLGYIEDKDTKFLKSLVAKESRLRADSNCSPLECHTESLRQLLLVNAGLLTMTDERGRNLLKIANSNNNDAVKNSAVSVIKECTHLNKYWRKKIVAESSTAKTTEALSSIVGYAERITSARSKKKPQDNLDLQTHADIESQRIRNNLYRKLGVGEPSVGVVGIGK